MKTHILLSLMALIFTACASNREVPSSQFEFDRNQHAQMIDGSASRIR